MAISMAKQYSIAAARDQLPALVHEAERGKHIRLTRRGKAVALLISVADYERLSSQRTDVWDKLQDFRSKHDLSDLDTDQIFENVRDRSPGRDFDW
jgi:prevent-host-death family protein